MSYVRTGEIGIYRYEPNKPKWPLILLVIAIVAIIARCSDEDAQKPASQSPPPYSRQYDEPSDADQTSNGPGDDRSKQTVQEH